VHHKLDGIWLSILKDHAYTGHPTDLAHQLGFCESVQKALASGIWWYGELYVPGEPASFVKSAIKHKDERLEFRPFAVPEWDTDCDLEDCAELAHEFGLRFAPFSDNYKVYRELIVSGKVQLAHDIEGFVFKNGNTLDWHKWKPVRTIDAFISGFTDGRGKYLGQTGSLIIRVCDDQQNEHVIANVSGMDDLVRAEISADEESYLGRVIEVEYQYVGSRGKLRHPRFKCFRDDKRPGDCTLDQDPELLENYPS
jgi:hypothetical protein